MVPDRQTKSRKIPTRNILPPFSVLVIRYNLGVAHLYGYGGYGRDTAAAAEWFERSGLPEGLMLAAVHRSTTGAGGAGAVAGAGGCGRAGGPMEFSRE